MLEYPRCIFAALQLQCTDLQSVDSKWIGNIYWSLADHTVLD